MQKHTKFNIDKMLNQKVSLDEALFSIENMIGDIPNYLIEDISEAFQFSTYLSFSEVIYLLPNKIGEKIFDYLDNNNLEDMTKNDTQFEIEYESLELLLNDINFNEQSFFENLNYISLASPQSLLTLAFIANNKLKKLDNTLNKQVMFQDIDIEAYNSEYKQYISQTKKDIFKLIDKKNLIEDELSRLVFNQTISYAQFLSSDYFKTKLCNLELFPIPQDISEKEFCSYLSYIFQFYKKQFLLQDVLLSSTFSYVEHNFFIKQNIDEDKTSSEFSRLSQLQNFSSQIINLNINSKDSLFDYIGCFIYPPNFCTLDKKRQNRIFEFSSNNTIDNFFHKAYQQFPLSAFSLKKSFIDSLFNQFNLESLSKEFQYLIKNNSMLAYAFAKKIDKNHEIFKDKNYDFLISLSKSSSYILENAPLKTWKKILTTNTFKEIYNNSLFSHAPSNTDDYVDEIFQSYLSHPNDGYKILNMSSNTAKNLLIKLYNIRDKSTPYEKDFFLAILKKIDPKDLSFNEQKNSTTVKDIVLEFFYKFNHFYNFDNTIPTFIQESEYAKGIVDFLAKLDVKNFSYFSTNHHTIPENVFLPAISLKPENIQEKFINDLVKIQFKDCLSIDSKTTSETEINTIKEFISENNNFDIILKWNPIVDVKYPISFDKITPSLLLLENHIELAIVNGASDSSLDISISQLIKEPTKFFKNAPVVSNFSDLMSLISTLSQSNKMKSDLITNNSSSTISIKNKIKKF